MTQTNLTRHPLPRTKRPGVQRPTPQLTAVLDVDSLRDFVIDHAPTPDEGRVLSVPIVDWQGRHYIAWLDTADDDADVSLGVMSYRSRNGYGDIVPRLVTAETVEFPVWAVHTAGHLAGVGGASEGVDR